MDLTALMCISLKADDDELLSRWRAVLIILLWNGSPSQGLTGMVKPDTGQTRSVAVYSSAVVTALGEGLLE